MIHLRHRSGETGGPPWRWAAWLLACLVAGAGLFNLRVDNGLGGWAPQLETLGPQTTYIVAGGEGDEVAAQLRALATLPQVGQVFDETAADRIGWMLGPDARKLVRNGNWHAAYLFARDGVDDATLVNAVTAAVAEMAGKVHLAGPAAYRVAMNRQSQRRMPVIASLVVVVGVLGVRLSRYAWGSALQISLIIGGAQVMTFGLLGWIGQAVDVTAMIAPPMMSALGFSLGLHRASGAGRGLLTACWATTVLATLSFALVDVPSVHQFALVAALGLTIVFAGMSLLVQPERRAASIDRPAFSFPTRRRWVVVACGLLVLAGGIVGGHYLRLETDGVKLLPADAPTRIAFEQLDEHLTGLLPSQVVIEPAWPGFGDVARDTPGVRAAVDVSLLQSTPAGSRWWVLASNDAGNALAAAQGDWQQSAADAGSTLAWRGVAAQLQATSDAIKEVAMTALPTAVVIVFAALLIMTRSLRIAIVGAAACPLPIAMLLILLSVLPVAVATTTLMVGAIATGAAADDVLHVGRAIARDASGRSLAGLVRPCLSSSFVSAGAMLPLLLSPFPPTLQFGLEMLAALVLAAMVVWLTMPMLLVSNNRTPGRATASHAGRCRGVVKRLVR